MTQKQIQVGIVGASAQKNWAHLSHVPAIHGLSGLRLAAVATRNEQSARKSAEAHGADRWFSDPLAMINDDQIDVITISVKVPAHRELRGAFHEERHVGALDDVLDLVRVAHGDPFVLMRSS